jgi:hypothetical protein
MLKRVLYVTYTALFIWHVYFLRADVKVHVIEQNHDCGMVGIVGHFLGRQKSWVQHISIQLIV